MAAKPPAPSRPPSPLGLTLSILAAVGIPAGLFFAPDFATRLDELGSAAWLTQLAVVPLLFVYRQGWTYLIVGAALAAYVGHDAGQLGLRHDRAFEARLAPSHDLRHAPLPPELVGQQRGWANLRGYLFLSQTIDEYQVAAGSRPDQATPAPKLLVPLTGFDPAQQSQGSPTVRNEDSEFADRLKQAHPDATIDTLTAAPEAQLKLRPDERLLIARVHAQPAPGRALATYSGRLEPVAPELVAALIELPDDNSGATLSAQALLFDTTIKPPQAPTPLELGRLALAAALALAALLLGVCRPGQKSPAA